MDYHNGLADSGLCEVVLTLLSLYPVVLFSNFKTLPKAETVSVQGTWVCHGEHCHLHCL